MSAALNTADLAWIRSEIGSGEPPTDDDLSAAYDRLGTALDVAVEVLAGRYADLVSSPAKWAVEGDFSIDNTATITALARQLAALRAQQGTEPTLTVNSLTRADPWR